MKSLIYPKIAIILAIGFLLVSGFLTDALAQSTGMTLNVKNQLGCEMEFTISTTTSGGSTFTAYVNPGQTYTVNLSLLFGKILNSIRVGPAFGATYYDKSGLALSGEPFTIILNTQGVAILNNSLMQIHTGVWTGGPCPK